MGDAPEHLDTARPAPGWPRRWFILFRLHDYLLGDALVLSGFWLRNRSAFWQYVMKVEEARKAREAAPDGLARGGARAARVPKPGAWRNE
jgi:hypothetical protein